MTDHAECPEDGHQCGYKRQPTHSSILEAFTVVSALEAADKWVQSEREEYHRYCDDQSVDQGPYVMPQQGQPDAGNDDSNHGIPKEHVSAAA